MKYLLRILAVIVILFVFGNFVYFFVNKSIVSYSASSFEKFEELFVSSQKFDVLLIGSSRTHRNIDVKICDSITALKFYNGGISGAHGFEMLTTLKGFLAAHSAPKLVVLNIDPGVFSIDRTFFNATFYFNSLNNGQIYEAFSSKGYPVWLYKHVPFTRVFEFNDDLRNDCIRGFIGKKDNYRNAYHGYLPMSENIGEFDTIYKTQLSIGRDSANFQYLNSIINVCKDRKIKLVFIVAPVYNHHYSKRYRDYSLIIEDLNTKIAKRERIPILFFDDQSLNYSMKYFDDNIHLNLKGTQEFSVTLAEQLKEQLK
jgi:hypothetical protein